MLEIYTTSVLIFTCIIFSLIVMYAAIKCDKRIKRAIIPVFLTSLLVSCVPILRTLIAIGLTISAVQNLQKCK